ncbi:MAG TPA: histidine phosphatase family protein [Atribacterota bacterium]|nr:histidine phosphatase family protein [Atribacterota bacterium]HOR42586.1 histidine phosphatase family protein [Atribacterota bacterium]
MGNHNEAKTRIILVRHGECQGNREGLFRGRSDFPLNENGFIQAKELGTELRKFEPVKIFTSPLSRAKETARIISKQCHIEIEICEEMNNIKLGLWEGKAKDFIARQYPEQWAIWLSEPEKLVLTGMETLDEVQQRARKGLNNIIKNHAGDTVIIISHRAVLKPLIASCLEMAKPYFWRIHMDTAAYSILHYDQLRGFVLVQLNQNRHLGKYISEWE